MAAGQVADQRESSSQINNQQKLYLLKKPGDELYLKTACKYFALFVSLSFSLAVLAKRTNHLVSVSIK